MRFPRSKSEAAFLFSFDRLRAISEKLYFWTFTSESSCEDWQFARGWAYFQRSAAGVRLPVSRPHSVGRHRVAPLADFGHGDAVYAAFAHLCAAFSAQPVAAGGLPGVHRIGRRRAVRLRNQPQPGARIG